jgi:hypothetical protein
MKELRPVLLGTRILPAHAHDWITIGLRITGIFPSQPHV